MGLQTNYTSLDGVSHPECYWRIILAQGDYISKEVRVTVARYHDQAARKAEKRAEYFPFTLSLDPKRFDTENARAAVYSSLKTLPELTAAIDILESV